MNTIFYDIILPILDVNSVKLLYSDTDSFVLRYYIFLDEYTEKNYFDAKFEVLQKFKDAGVLDTSNFPKNHPLYDTKLKGSLFAIKSENPSYVFGEWVALAPKVYTFLFIAYHLNKITSEIKNHINCVSGAVHNLNYLFTDINSAIFEVKNDLIKNLDDLKNHLMNIDILLEGHHQVQITFVEFLELSEDIRESLQIKPLCATFYDKNILDMVIKKKSAHANSNHIYFLEIDGEFNVHIFRYALHFFDRPIPDKNILSDAELVIRKSKTCAGIPGYKTDTITEIRLYQGSNAKTK